MFMTQNPDHKIVILGAGITGLTAARKLSEKYHNRVILVEKENYVGGLAATFYEKGMAFDFGSHRIHADWDNKPFGLVLDLLGEDLLKRPRRGLIKIGDNFMPYPATPFGLGAAFGPGRSFKFFCDYLLSNAKRVLIKKKREDFESYALSRVGPSFYKIFFKPYAEKLCGTVPTEISYEMARNRLGNFKFSKILSRLASRTHQTNNRRVFYYPREGIGQITSVLRKQFLNNGGVLYLDTKVAAIHSADNGVERVEFERLGGEKFSAKADQVVSTIPLPDLLQLCGLLTQSRKSLFSYRGLCVVNLRLSSGPAGDNETFYIPETRWKIGRVSEIHKYSPFLNNDRKDFSTVLTMEIPCSEGGPVWSMNEMDLGKVCFDELKRLGIVRDASAQILDTAIRRAANVYPVLRLGWRDELERAIGALDKIANLYLVGRSALFLHCNIDHCVQMGTALA